MRRVVSNVSENTLVREGVGTQLRRVVSNVSENTLNPTDVAFSNVRTEPKGLPGCPTSVPKRLVQRFVIMAYLRVQRQYLVAYLIEGLV